MNDGNPYDYLLQRPGGRGHPMQPAAPPTHHAMPPNPMAMGYSYPDPTSGMLDMSMAMNPIPYNAGSYNPMPMMGHGHHLLPGGSHHGMGPPSIDPTFHPAYMPPSRPDNGINSYYMMNDGGMNYSSPMYPPPPQQSVELPRAPVQRPTPSVPKANTTPKPGPAPTSTYQPLAHVAIPPSRPLEPSTAITSAPSSSTHKAVSEASYESGEENVAKSEKRRSQVRDASRRRRAKHKEEEAMLVNRIKELKQQVQIMEGSHPSSDGGAHPMSAMSDHDLEQAFKDQKKVVETLKAEYKDLKARLKHHEEFARSLQQGIQALSGSGGPAMNTLMGGFNSMVAELPAQSFDWSWIHRGDMEWVHEVVRTGFQELNHWKPPTSANEPVNASAMGWTSDFWEDGDRTMCFSTHKLMRDGVLRDFVDKTWGILSNRDKSRRVYPDWKELEVLKWVSEDIAIVRIFESVGPRNVTFCAVVFRIFVDEQHYLVGMKSYAMTPPLRQITASMRAQEACAWKFSVSRTEPGVDVEFVGYQDVDQTVKSKAGMEAMFVMLRWESEAVTQPVFRPPHNRLIQ
ncbi:hypothetical protein SPRG_12690 [Saprolegnia parasitica CBS 223.65]|uniref:BZIP domain-containing protein n=1 Tax=Saprolegnia parasitica (strain CBS 223.65) TaxID=695850 RepID=A0A067BUN5_SAPPC|nr:hypothetical protein SPRG_12690 [Saprolegnia parasitica CBS 223.65]KDO22194.1 hypothetical protein SPRG_12690 [Saprolegnia parasitica CBS 223.65]|eukprot:XP_012207130.1 hypothetical protein SPRG_12690 [Saprolegnia parasitica CBS 223.65]